MTPMPGTNGDVVLGVVVRIVVRVISSVITSSVVVFNVEDICRDIRLVEVVTVVVVVVGTLASESGQKKLMFIKEIKLQSTWAKYVYNTAEDDECIPSTIAHLQSNRKIFLDIFTNRNSALNRAGISVGSW